MGPGIQLTQGGLAPYFAKYNAKDVFTHCPKSFWFASLTYALRIQVVLVWKHACEGYYHGHVHESQHASCTC